MYKLDWGSILITIFMILATVLIGSHIHYTFITETKTISGEIIDYELYDDYIELTFDTGDVIKANLKGSSSGFGTEVLDFTVNSELIVKFDKRSWWFMPDEDRWDVIQIIKMPDVGDNNNDI